LLRRKFGPKRKCQKAGENCLCFTKYYYDDQIKEVERVWGYSMRGRDEKYIKILVRKPVGKRPLGTHRHRYEDSFIMDLRKINRENVD
jgi:hypothetical protein